MTNNPEDQVVIAYKGFDKNLQCRGYQFSIGAQFSHDGPVASCKSGFHACKHPLAVFEFYPPATSRYAEVKISGDVCDRQTDDTKIAAARISIEVELTISDLVKRAWDYVWSRATIEPGSSATGYRGAASATGYRGAASATGYQGAASATGKNSVAMACGFDGRAMALEGCSLVVHERDANGDLIGVHAEIIGKGDAKPGVYYRLKAGKLEEVTP